MGHAAKAPLLDLSELADQAGVTTRTIRFYIQQGLVPSPGQGGPGPKYGRGHVARLRLIRRLQREHLPLAEVRKRLEGLDEAGVEAALAAAPAASAVDYVRQVLGGGPTPDEGPARSQWERVALAEDIELHVRRPLSREQNRRLERLLAEARRIFQEET